MNPNAIPIAAPNHTVAAVVKFRTVGPLWNIIPAPKNPIPVTICAAILDGAATSVFSDKNVNSIDPHITNAIVLIPASFPLASLSNPISIPAITLRIIPTKKFDISVSILLHLFFLLCSSFFCLISFRRLIFYLKF